MRTQVLFRILGLFFLMTGWITLQAQDQLEVPGDNFSLEGALEMFKKSGSPEEFERMLNDPESRVNNLDLNGDGYIDYIRVIDRYEGNVHAFILQAVVSQRENQDIAVITLEKLANGKAVLQIIGDEDIYGVETIIEPTREVRTYGGTRSTHVVIDVWAWPFVRYVYGPHYSVWISPWGWYSRPHWWHPWRPIAYYDYYPYWRHYRPYYRVCHTHRVVYAQRIYRPHRTTSVVVSNRYNRQITNYRSTRIDNDGRYRSRSSRSGNYQTANTSVRYNSDGRIVSDRTAGSRTSTRTNARTRTTENNSRSSATRSERSYSSGTPKSNQRSSTPDLQRSRERTSGSSGYSRSTATPRSERSYRSESPRSNERSVTPNVQRSRERSTGSSSYSRSSGTSRSDRSYSRPSGSSQRSYSTPNTRRSTGESSGRSGSGRSGSSNSRGRR